MRPRHQQGQIVHDGPNWVLRFYEDRVIDGHIKRVRTKRQLAAYSEYPYRGTKADLTKLRSTFYDQIQKILSPVNKGGFEPRNGITAQAKSTITLGEYIESSYFPRLDQRLRLPAGNELHIEPSTVKGYKDIWKVHVKDDPAAKVQLRNFTPRVGQTFLESLPQELSHKTHMRIKNFLRGVFTWAVTEDIIQFNPMADTKAGGQTKRAAPKTERQRKIQESNRHAYTLAEVAEMLDKLEEPARTVCALAAFTGFTRSELRGLKWSDYDGETIRIQRKVWNQHVGSPKTEAREADVYVIPLLRKILAKYGKKYPAVGESWIFRGERLLKPLDLDNLSRRNIPEHIDGAWFGWHAFRRGLGTRLNEAGIDDKTIQTILRHANISTTLAYYIKPDQKQTAAGLKKLDKIMNTKYGIKR